MTRDEAPLREDALQRRLYARVVAPALAFGGRSDHDVGMARAPVRQLLMLVATLVVAAPLLFGPALPWALEALGGGPTHTCACGMKQGQCGCPECARLTAQRKAENAPTAYRTFKRACEDDAPAAPAAPLPPAVPALAALAPAPSPVARALPAPAGILRTRDRAPPPPPPPRA